MQELAGVTNVTSKVLSRVTGQAEKCFECETEKNRLGLERGRVA